MEENKEVVEEKPKIVADEARRAMEFINKVLDDMLPKGIPAPADLDPEEVIKKAEIYKNTLYNIVDIEDYIIQMNLLYGLMDVILTSLIVERNRRTPKPAQDFGFDKLIEDSIKLGFSKDVS